jgi:hypothetical protein
LSVETQFGPTSQPNRNENKVELFKFLKGLKNLQSLSLDPKWHTTVYFDLSHLPALMEAIKNAPLQKLFLNIALEPTPSDVITPGPTGLDTLSIIWNTNAFNSESEEHDNKSAYNHLYALITPSLSSLSRLELNFRSWAKPVPEFDLTLLKDAAENIRAFRYEVETDVSATVMPIKTVTETFPKLTELTLLDFSVWEVRSYRILQD